MSIGYIRNMAGKKNPTPLENYEPGCTKDEFFAFLSQACRPIKTPLVARQVTPTTKTEDWRREKERRLAELTKSPLVMANKSDSDHRCNWPGCSNPGKYGAYRSFTNGRRFLYYCEAHIERIEADNLLGNQEQSVIV